MNDPLRSGADPVWPARPTRSDVQSSESDAWLPERHTPSRLDPLTQALTTVRDVTDEVVRVVRDVATRFADVTPLAPVLARWLGAPTPEHETHEPDSPSEVWRTRLADAESSLAVAMHRAAELEERCERAVHGLAEAGAREQALRAELATALERSCVEREAVSRRADQLVATVEEQRAAAARDAEAVRAALAAAQQASLAQRNELFLARNEAARHTALAEEARQARDQLEVEAQALRARFSEAQERLRALEADASRLAEERRRVEVVGQTAHAERETRYRTELATLQTDYAREHDRAQALADEVERQRTELETLERREQRLREEVQNVARRADTDREDTVRRAQEMVQAAEHARATATAELEALRTALAGDRARLLQMEAEHERAEQGVAEREAALASARTAIEQLDQSRVTTAAELERTRGTLVQTERELLAVQHELGLAQRQLDKLCTAHDELVEDQLRVSTLYEEARTREAELRTRTDGLREQIRTLEIDRGRLLELERVQQDRAATDEQLASRRRDAEQALEDARERLHRVEAEHAKAAVALEQTTLRERRLQDELATALRAATEQESLLTEARALADVAERERASAAAELESLRTSMASAQRLILEAEDETRAARADASRLAVEHATALAEGRRTGPAADAAAPKVATPATKPTSSAPGVALDARNVAILDTATEWPAHTGVETMLVAPGGPVLPRVQEFGPGRCLVNLAAPGAIAAAATLRANAPDVPFFGCAIGADGERGIPIGLVDVLARPIDADAVRNRVVRIAPRSARVLAIGSDSAAFIGLRQGLMKGGMSVSIAWDLKQAAELIGIVRAHVVILDLALPPRGAASLMVELSRTETPPAIAIIPAADDALATFAQALGGFVTGEFARSRANLLRTTVEAKIPTA